ncbi:flagellar protein G [Archaeoglobales archaeon]|nr:MAG: flagellar protein G [Archaeoglobales archaeon]
MGFGDSASHMIFFIASILVAASVSAVLFVTVQKMSIEIQEQGEHLKQIISTDFEIINDPDSIPSASSIDGTIYTFYIKNTGTNSIVFTPETVTVIIDGLVVGNNDLSLTPYGKLKAGEVGQINVTTTLNTGDHKITVVLENGISDTLEFSVG